ncbi:MAG: CoA transferase [Pseudomonadota bacterium]
MTTRSLDGLRVLELARNVAGPYAGKMFADQGAEVFKLEPLDGDPSRTHGPFIDDTPNPEASGLFLHLNRGKKSIAIDPGSPEGVSLIHELATKVDIVIEDYAPGEATRWGWGWTTLRSLNPRLVLTSITPFGQTGPYRDYRGSELTLQAFGGPLITNGHEAREPLKLAGHFAHYHAGLMASVATLMALRRAEASGQGDWIDLSVYECQAACRDRQCVWLTIAAYTGLSMGRLRASAARMGAGARQCDDGFVNIMGAGARVPQLLGLIGRDDLADRPGLTNPAGTVPPDLFEEVEGAYAAWLKGRKKADVVKLAQSQGVLAGAVNTIGDVMADEHFRAREVWENIDHPHTGELTYPGRPYLFSNSPQTPPRRAPLLDEHRDTVSSLSQRASPPAPPPSALPLPMAGLRVVEVTVVWAGPHVTQLFGDWGADVVRVEPAHRPQPTTRGVEEVPTDAQADALAKQGIPTRLADNRAAHDPWNRNAAFNTHARNKRAITCNIMSEQGRKDLLALLAKSDIFVENNVPETMDKAGITWEELHALNPRLIWLRMPAFALSGPYRNYRAFGLHVEAMVGHTHLRGYPGESPEQLSESLASDGIAGVQGAVALLMALRHREQTGEGQLIEMPLTEGFLPTLGEFILEHAMNRRDAPTQGNLHPQRAPHNVYPCQGTDEWIAIDVGSDDEFARLAKCLKLPSLATDTRFATAAARREHRSALDAQLAEQTKVADKNALFHQLQAERVCAAPVRRATEVLADPHLDERAFFESLPTGDERTEYPYPGLSFRLHHTPNRLRTGPVRLGEHNREIYTEVLGYSDAEYEALVDAGIATTRFPETVWKPT